MSEAEKINENQGNYGCGKETNLASKIVPLS